MKLPFCKFALAASLLVATSWANATITVFNAFLDQNEGIPTGSPATGSAVVTWDSIGHTMRVQVTFAGLLGTTTASHIHAPTPAPFTGTAGVATTTPTFAGFPLGVTSGTYDNTLAMLQASSYNPAFVTANGGTPATAEAALFSAMAAGESYLNIHTSLFTGGPIRGFLIAAVPEPETYAMMLAGLGLLGFVARRRKQIAG